MLTSNQLLALKNDIASDPALSLLPNTADNAFDIAKAYNAVASPTFIVWRTNVHEHEITRKTSSEGTNWSWPAYIARTENERDAWKRMFNSTLQVDASLPNVRQGIQDIFSGSANSAPAQRTHISAICKRSATRAEKLFATGTGSVPLPATMGFEGSLTYQEVFEARSLP